MQQQLYASRPHLAEGQGNVTDHGIGLLARRQLQHRLGAGAGIGTQPARIGTYAAAPPQTLHHGIASRVAQGDKR